SQRDRRCSQEGRSATHANQSWLDPRRLLYVRPGVRLEHSKTLRYEAIWTILSPNAGTGGIPGPLSIRSRVPLDRSLIIRYRVHDQSRAFRLQNTLKS